MRSRVIACVTATVFREFDWDRYELSEFSDEYEIYVVELFDWLDGKRVKSEAVHSEKYPVIRVGTTVQLIALLARLCIRSRFRLRVIDLMWFEPSLRWICAKFMLLMISERIVCVLMSGVAGNREDYSIGYRQVLRRARSYGLKKTCRWICWLTVIGLYFGCTRGKLAYVVGGKNDYYFPETFLTRRNCKLLRGSSWDYSNWIRYREIKPRSRGQERYGVLLDGAGPASLGDVAYEGSKHFLTPKAWYPALCRLMSSIEKTTGCKTVIVAHPSVRHSISDIYFESRETWLTYNDRMITMQLVRNAEYVITRHSTAISYALIYKKPVILVTSKELEGRENTWMYKALNKKPVNIDDFNGREIDSNLRVDSNEAGEVYIRNYLSSGAERSNGVIIKEYMEANED